MDAIIAAVQTFLADLTADNFVAVIKAILDTVFAFVDTQVEEDIA